MKTVKILSVEEFSSVVAMTLVLKLPFSFTSQERTCYLTYISTDYRVLISNLAYRVVNSEDEDV